MEFEKGTVVQLKSGGPHMTVSGFRENGETTTVWVSWFDQQGKLESHCFSSFMLKYVTAK